MNILYTMDSVDDQWAVYNLVILDALIQKLEQRLDYLRRKRLAFLL